MAWILLHVYIIRCYNNITLQTFLTFSRLKKHLFIIFLKFVDKLVMQTWIWEALMSDWLVGKVILLVLAKLTHLSRVSPETADNIA
jgi:hypothetical protein